MSNDTPPDHLSVNPRSKFHDADLLQRGIGIRFNGQERTDVEEYCVSEGWIRVQFGKALDRRGQPMTIKKTGTVEPYFLDLDAAAKPAAKGQADDSPGSPAQSEPD